MKAVEMPSESNQETLAVGRDNVGKFLPGYNGFNQPIARSSSYWSTAVRRQEFRRSIKRLLDIRDGRIEELGYTKGGKRVTVVAKIEHVIKACEILLGYAAGKPAQRIDMSVAGGAESINALQIVLQRPGSSDGAGDAGDRTIINVVATPPSAVIAVPADDGATAAPVAAPADVPNSHANPKK